MTDHDWATVSRRLEEMQQRRDFSGIALVSQGDLTLLESCHGWAERGSRTPVTPATRFGLASMCKMFTALGVLDAVRRGEVTLDARVVDVLPGARRPSTLSGDINVHQLLTHSSGIGDYAEEDDTLPGYLDDYSSLWHDLPNYRMERVDDFLPLYHDRPPVAPAGTEFHYSNAGYLLLGAVLEEVSGQEFTEVIRARVLDPAGMADTGYVRLDAPEPDLATGYYREPDGWRSNIYDIPVVGGPDGGAFATARDIDRCLRAIASGSLLGPDLRDRMLTPHLPVGEGMSMGYGVFLRPDGSFGHGGGDPGVETLARHFPGLDTSIVLLCNTDDGLEDAWELLTGGLVRD